MAGINCCLCLICLHLENGIIKPWTFCEVRSWQGDILMTSLVDFSRRPGTGMEMSSPTKWSWVEWSAQGQSYRWHTATMTRRWPALRVGCGLVLESPAQKVRISKYCFSLFLPEPSSRGVQGTISYSSQTLGFHCVCSGEGSTVDSRSKGTNNTYCTTTDPDWWHGKEETGKG